MKRYVAILVCIVLLVTLGACGKDGEQQSAKEVGESIKSEEILEAANKSKDKTTDENQVPNNEPNNDNTTGEEKMTTTNVKDTENFYGIIFTADSDIFTRIKGKSYKDETDMLVMLLNEEALGQLHREDSEFATMYAEDFGA